MKGLLEVLFGESFPVLYCLFILVYISYSEFSVLASLQFVLEVERIEEEIFDIVTRSGDR